MRIDVTNEVQTTGFAPEVLNSLDGINQNISNDLKHLSMLRRAQLKLREKKVEKNKLQLKQLS